MTLTDKNTHRYVSGTPHKLTLILIFHFNDQMSSISTSCLLGKNVFTINCRSETTRGRFKEVKGRKDFKLE